MSQQDGNPATKHVYFDCGLHTAPWTKAGAGCPICHRKSLKDVEEYVNTVARESDPVLRAIEREALKAEIAAKHEEIRNSFEEMCVPKITVPMRVFETGATRNVNDDKLDMRGFLSYQALKFFASYMHKHRIQADGTKRAADNWKKGIPIPSYVESLDRHEVDFQIAVDEGRWEEAEELACAMFFNIQGFLHERLKLK